MRTHRPRQAIHWLPALFDYFSFFPLVLVRRECVSPSVGSNAGRGSDQDSARPNRVNIAVALDLGLQHAQEAAEPLWYHKGGQRAACVTGGILRWGLFDESTVVDLCLGSKAIV